MLRSRKVHTGEREAKENYHSTTIQDMRDGMSIKKKLVRAQKKKGAGIGGMVKRIGENYKRINKNMIEQAKKMPPILK